MTLPANDTSFQRICPNTAQVMVYGYGHCKYKELANDLLNLQSSQIKRVFSGDIAKSQMNRATRTTLENRVMAQIRLEPMDLSLSMEESVLQQCARECKAALVNIVLENYRRAKEGLELIPVLFCMDIDDENNKWSPNTKNFTSKEKSSNAIMTHKELRRAYKLCCDQGVDKEVQEVARRTFIFVKLQKGMDDRYRLEAIDAPWMKRNWAGDWNQRMAQSNSLPRMHPWRTQLHEIVLKLAAAETEKVRVVPPTDGSFCRIL